MITIQKVNPDDAARLSRIAYAAKAHWGYPAAWMEEWRDAFTFTREYFETNESWAAELDDKPVAFCTLLDKDGIAWVENLWVLPEHMGLGIGRRLLLHAVEAARERGFNKLQLESDPNAAGFYARLGMHKISERRADMDGQSRALPLMEMIL